ncbi:MAG TPA: UDP-2,3-diacylglucosamine diphosphatase, partial [Burkholderiaceae bacterium]|nr:UDP-2,3-diacylglucosamine diphosphatase [Burkholderiaceae bacterium]
ANHVFLLGDLFEAWVGDDQPDAVAADAIRAFAQISETGRKLYVMRGNRDFLLGRVPPAAGQGTAAAEPGAQAQGFVERSGATMLDDPCTIELFGEPVVLAHGDALCTDDHDYQKIRAVVRGDAWQTQFLTRPLAERLALARQLREQSEQVKASRYEISDVAQAAVDATLRAAGARAMIHGHTHRPACHEWQLDGGQAHRWVLSDWDAAIGRGGFLRVDRNGFARLPTQGLSTP